MCDKSANVNQDFTLGNFELMNEKTRKKSLT